MKALLLKNWLTLRKGNPLFLVFLLVYTLVGAFTDNPLFYGSFVALLSALLPKNIIAFDERSGWERYAAALPLSRRTQVLAVYAMALLCSAVSTALFCGLRAILLAIHPERFPASTPLPTLAALMMVIALLMCASNYPFIFKLGVERGRAAMMLSAVLAVLLGVTAYSAMEMDIALHFSPAVCAATVAACALVCLGSLLLSIRLYESRNL